MSAATVPAAPTTQAAPDAAQQPAAVPRRARADGRPFASPLARALAREHGVDLSAVASGPDGAVRAAQVRAAAGPGATPPAGSATDDSARIGAAPVGSATDGAAPSSERIALLVADVDVTGVERALRDGAAGFAAREGVEPTMFAAVVHAAVRSLRRCPGIHATDGTGPVTLSVHRGDGTDRELPDAGDLGFAGLLRALGSPDPVPAPGPGPGTSGAAPGSAPMPGHGVTVVDSGATGIALELVPPPPGRRAALTVGRVRRDVGVVTVDGAESIAIRSLLRLGLAVDTTRVDRAAAAAFLEDLENRLAAGADLPTTPSTAPRTLT